MPNRDFIATHVLNWTLSDNVIRLFLTVGIAYGSDVEKALRLLTLFSEQRPELGLSELARLAGYDKATSRRLLVALQRYGLIEQSPGSRRYRLGTTVLQLARIREAVGLRSLA